MQAKHDYTELDAEIIKSLGNGPIHFRQMLAIKSLVWEARTLEADEKARNPGRWNTKEAFRFIDGRLQALRRAGRITHTTAKGWELSK